ncbi:vacuolar protein-sorting-associated protein 25 isoform X1 [Pelodiscus sinensis]|uniref:vacuolar protein-sorting-associated protein 25 isoform X1 n=1 Tax=Pelodiscus sinensis TaxID=13735 RepID=UPI003F6BF816
MSFEWPWQYRFPPFFTLQPNVDTRQKQMTAWCSLVLSYCRLNKLYTMTVLEAQESPLFNNRKLQRKLPMESIQVVLEELRKKGNLEWLDKNKSTFLIMWRRPEEWGKLIYQWVSKNGLTNSVFTLYELSNGDDTANEGLTPITTEKRGCKSYSQPARDSCIAVCVIPACLQTSLPSPCQSSGLLFIWLPGG